jgi:uncharacterized protein (TIGR02757 family)
VAGFIASQFAYGRVQLVTRFLGELFGRMGDSPYAFIREGDLSVLRGLYYRLHKGADIIELFRMLRQILRKFGSIGGMLEHFYEGDLRAALWAARNDVIRGDSHLFFFPKRGSSSPLKRWSLYARWMVRRDEIDFGLWNFMDKASLVVPLDANIFKIGTCHGWTDQKAQTWKTACQITNVLKTYCPDDPLKYDFFLCHVVGINGGCSGVKSSACAKRCLLYEV